MQALTDMFKKNLDKKSIADLKILEGKKMNEISKQEELLVKLNQELNAIKTAIREKQK